MAVEIPGLDVNSGLKICDGSMDIYLHALRLYASNVPPALEKMRGVSGETLKNYSTTAHSIKTMCQYIGAEEAGKTAKELEALARDGNLAGILAQNEAFIKKALGIVDNVQKWLEKNGPTA